MTRRSAVTFAICILLLASMMSGAAQRGPEGTAEISGAVTTTGDAATPLARVLVTISGASLTPSRTIITDDQGRFAFRDLPPGSFTIVAARPPFIRTTFGARRPGRAGTPINLAAAQRVTDVMIRLARGAAITGVVRYPGGEPAPGIQIVASTLDAPSGATAPPSVTDDRGVYRLFGLPPGRYIVSATVAGGGNTAVSQMSDAEMDDVLASLQRRSRTGAGVGSSVPGARPAGAPAKDFPRAATYSYAPIYYPGMPDPDQAEAVDLAEGDERAAMDFDLQLVRASTIEGRVSIPGEALPSSTQVTLTRSLVRAGVSRALNAPATARLDGSGSFRFANVLPGRYRLVARAMTVTPVATSQPAGAPQPASYRTTGVFWAASDVTVGDDDLAGVALTLHPAFKLTGRTVFEARTLAPPESVQLRLTELGGTPMSMRSGGGRAGGPFEISGLVPGTYTITSPLSEAGWWLRSVVIGGRDVLDFPLELGAAGDVSGAVATFTDQRTELSGTLQSAANIPAPDYFVVAFAADRTFWRPGSRRVQSTRPGTDGLFILRDLPAGDYLIAAVTDLEPSDLGDVSFIERLVPVALKVRLGEGEKKTQDLTLAR